MPQQACIPKSRVLFIVIFLFLNHEVSYREKNNILTCNAAVSSLANEMIQRAWICNYLVKMLEVD